MTRSLLVPIRTYSRCFIVEGAIGVRAVVESSIPAFDWTPSTLVHEVPVKAGERSVLVTFVLQKSSTLLDPEFLQVPGR